MRVTMLITYVELDDRGRSGPGLSVSARLEAALGDGSRVVLLDDRGWASTGPARDLDLADVERTARMVVGPDEPAEGRSHVEEAALHWEYLAAILRKRVEGCEVEGAVLPGLPHPVVPGPLLAARITPPRWWGRS